MFKQNKTPPYIHGHDAKNFDESNGHRAHSNS